MTTIDIIIIIIIIHKRQPRGHRLTTNSVYLRQEVGGKVQIGENVQHRNGQTTVCHHQLPITDIPLRVYMSVCVCFTITSLSAQSNSGRCAAALSQTYAVKSPLVTMARPKFAPKNTPSRGPIHKPHYLPHPWTRPTYDAKPVSYTHLTLPTILRV